MSPLPPRRVLLRWMLVADVLLLAALYIGAAWWRGRPIHEYLQNPERRTQSPGLFRSDARLGYAAVPGAQGTFVFPGGGVTHIRFDRHGFRVPQHGGSELSSPIVMTLGCSYAFGDAVAAEQTFSTIVAERLHARPMNAALSGYGLAQMTLLAEQVIPQHRPNLVLVEYAPWLVDRAMSATAPAAFGDIPTPYFTTDGDVALPYFESAVFSTPFWEFSDRTHRRSGAAFLFKASLPYYVATDIKRLGHAVRAILGRVPVPSGDRVAVIRDAYARIVRVARAGGAETLVFGLAAGPAAPPQEVVDAITGAGAAFVDADAVLTRALPAPTPESYQQHYAVWAGQPPKMVDPHPNADANRLIADAIVAAIDARRLLAAPQ